MQEFKKYKIVHIARSIGPTSMPWNDLFYNIKTLYPNLQHEPLAINFKASLTLKYINEDCSDKCFTYLKLSIFGSLFFFKFILDGYYKKSYYIFHVHNPTLAAIGILYRVFIPRLSLFIIYIIFGRITKLIKKYACLF